MNEREMEILEQYTFRTERISRVRGAFLCETDEGLRLMKETDKTEKRLTWENDILLRFPEHGELRVESYVENKDGLLLTEGADHRHYAVKRWFGGRECSMTDRTEILRTVGVLAKLHLELFRIGEQIQSSTGVSEDSSACEKNPGFVRNVHGWISDLEKHNRELIRGRNFIRKKRQKSELELKILSDFEEYYEQAEMALNLSAETGDIPMSLYHGDFTYHHILYADRDHRAVITGFSHMGWGVQQEDLYHFLRKVMEKHNWDVGLGQEMLNRYEAIRPLLAEEKRFIYARLLYPEKFWKQVNYYCNSRKSFLPMRNLEKLQVLESQRYNKDYFMKILGERLVT